MKSLALGAVAIIAWSGWLAGDAACAEATVPPEIQEELARFAQAWERPAEPASPYTIPSVLGLLDLALPGLAEVRRASEQGDHDQCGRLLLGYFRKRYAAEDPAAAKAVRQPDPTIAADALRHVFRGNGNAHPPVFRGARIDWRSRAAEADGRIIQDDEWLLQYHRLTWWPSLATAYRATRDEKYFDEWRYELVHYADTNLPITRKDPPCIARGMEVGRRCIAIASTLPVFIHSPRFDTKLLAYALHSVHHQVEHLRTVYAAKMNHRLSDLSDVFSSGVAFPEFRKSAEWKAEAAELLPKIMFDDIYEDGMNKEVVFSYHSMYIGLFCQAYRLFKDHGFGDRISPEFYKRLVKMADVYASAIFPDFSLPQFGDGWKNRRNPGRLLVDTLGFAQADLPYAEFMASNGTKGTPPRTTSRAFPTSGFYFFRSAWDAQAAFMAVKSTEKGEFHNQHDNGTFELYAQGRNFMIDSGCYIYGSQSEEERRQREWFRSSKVHQTLTLDDANAQRVPRFVLWKETPSVEALVIDNDSYAGLTHRRTILFVEKRWFLIHDEAIGSASGEVAIHFQFVPCDFRQDGTLVETRFPSGPNLKVRCFPCGSQPRYQPEDGWISYEILKKLPRPAWKWAIDKKADQPQVGFLTVLLPTEEKGQADATAASVTTGQDGRIYDATVDGAGYRIRLDAVKGGLSCERH